MGLLLKEQSFAHTRQHVTQGDAPVARGRGGLVAFVFRVWLSLQVRHLYKVLVCWCVCVVTPVVTGW